MPVTSQIKKIDDWLYQKGAILKEKEITFPSGLVGSVIFLILSGILWLVLPSQIQESGSDVVSGRAFPSMLIILIAICAIAVIITECIKIIKKEPLQTMTINLLVEVKALIIFLLMLVFYFLAKYVHFALGAVTCAIGINLFFRCKKTSYYVISCVAALLIWAAFEFGLNVRF